jgi:alanine racemase
MTRPVRARIDLQALGDNLSLARQLAPASRVMAVVKADAYGHGLVPAASALDRADAFAVVSLDEAARLREAGIDKPVTLLEGLYGADEVDDAVALNLGLVVHCEEQLQWLERADAVHRMPLWIKFDTGMHRLGFAPERASEIYVRLMERAVPAHNLGWMSHLACADEPRRPETARQTGRFLAAVESLPGTKSLANSAALMSRPDSQLDWVRPGIMLYGGNPMTSTADCPHPLNAVMTLETTLIAVNRCFAGDAVGYGGAYVCPRDMHVGVAAVGYGDGYPRHAPQGTPVLVDGRRCPLIGRVSMDMITIDLATVPEARVGDPVVLWGRGLPIDEIARHAGTINYELMCGITARVPRCYD